MDQRLSEVFRMGLMRRTNGLHTTDFWIWAQLTVASRGCHPRNAPQTAAEPRRRCQSRKSICDDLQEKPIDKFHVYFRKRQTTSANANHEHFERGIKRSVCIITKLTRCQSPSNAWLLISSMLLDLYCTLKTYTSTLPLIVPLSSLFAISTTT